MVVVYLRVMYVNGQKIDEISDVQTGLSIDELALLMRKNNFEARKLLLNDTKIIETYSGLQSDTFEMITIKTEIINNKVNVSLLEYVSN